MYFCSCSVEYIESMENNNWFKKFLLLERFTLYLPMFCHINSLHKQNIYNLIGDKVGSKTANRLAFSFNCWKIDVHKLIISSFLQATHAARHAVVPNGFHHPQMKLSEIDEQQTTFVFQSFWVIKTS